LNYSLSSPSWTYHKVNPDTNQSPFTSGSPVSHTQYRDTSGIEFIADEKDLDKYLKEFEANTSVKNLNNQTEQPSNLLSSFWSHPVTKTAKDMSSFLKRCTYQLSTQSPSKFFLNKELLMVLRPLFQPILIQAVPKTKLKKRLRP
jgi:hypothetical protein